MFPSGECVDELQKCTLSFHYAEILVKNSSQIIEEKNYNMYLNEWQLILLITSNAELVQYYFYLTNVNDNVKYFLISPLTV